MHRTLTTTTLLLGAAVSAVSGCVSVDPAPTPVSPRHEPRLTREVAPQIVQGPAREALDAAAEDTDPVPEPTPSRRAAPPPEHPSAAVPPKPPRAERPERRAPLRVLPSLPLGGPDVCRLGKVYGGWRPDSPEARICRDAYGN